MNDGLGLVIALRKRIYARNSLCSSDEPGWAGPQPPREVLRSPPAYADPALTAIRSSPTPPASSSTSPSRNRPQRESQGGGDAASRSAPSDRFRTGTLLGFWAGFGVYTQVILGRITQKIFVQLCSRVRCSRSKRLSRTTGRIYFLSSAAI